MIFGMSPSQSMFQQHYLPPTYPTSSLATATNIYQLTPDMYQYPPAANTYQQQYQPMATVSPSAYQQQQLVSSTTAGSRNAATQVTTDPHYQPMTTFSSSAYQQQQFVSSAVAQEQYAASSSFTTGISSQGISQNDNVLNSSHNGNELMPCKIKYHRNAQSSLPSTEINKQSLRSIQEVLEENINSRTESCAGKLCQRLAREAVFGEDVMKQCTPYGTREYPGLPRAELYELKMIMFNQFPRFHRCPSLFEDVWKKCIGSVEQACRRSRLKERKN